MAKSRCRVPLRLIYNFNDSCLTQCVISALNYTAHLCNRERAAPPSPSGLSRGMLGVDTNKLKAARPPTSVCHYIFRLGICEYVWITPRISISDLWKGDCNSCRDRIHHILQKKKQHILSTVGQISMETSISTSAHR